MPLGSIRGAGARAFPPADGRISVARRNSSRRLVSRQLASAALDDDRSAAGRALRPAAAPFGGSRLARRLYYGRARARVHLEKFSEKSNDRAVSNMRAVCPSSRRGRQPRPPCRPCMCQLAARARPAEVTNLHPAGRRACGQRGLRTGHLGRDSIAARHFAPRPRLLLSFRAAAAVPPPVPATRAHAARSSFRLRGSPSRAWFCFACEQCYLAGYGSSRHPSVSRPVVVSVHRGTVTETEILLKLAIASTYTCMHLITIEG